MLLVPLPRPASSFALPQDFAFAWAAQPAPEPLTFRTSLPALELPINPPAASPPAIALPDEAPQPITAPALAMAPPALAVTAAPDSSALPQLDLTTTAPADLDPPPAVEPPPPVGLALPTSPLPAAPPPPPGLSSAPLPLFTPPPPVTGPADPAALLAALGMEPVLPDWGFIPAPPLLAWPML